MTDEIRPVDQARASQMIVAQLAGDTEMFAVALQDTLDDDYGFGEFGSLINVLRVLTADLAGALLDIHGKHAVDLVRTVLARQLAEEGR